MAPPPNDDEAHDIDVDELADIEDSPGVLAWPPVVAVLADDDKSTPPPLNRLAK